MTDLIYSDAKLLALLRERDETALSVIQRQYGRKALHLANRILGSESDAEECVNDALLDIWNTAIFVCILFLPAGSPPCH